MTPRNKQNNTCAICGKPLKGVKGAKVYHFKCLYESLKEARERNSG